MSEWNEFRVVFKRSWVEEKREKSGRSSARWPEDLWGVEVDAKGCASVDVQQAVAGWKNHALEEICRAGAQQRKLRVGPFVLEEAHLELMNVGGSLRLVLEGRVLVRASTPADAEEALDRFKNKANISGTITVLSDLEALVKGAQEEDDAQ